MAKKQGKYAAVLGRLPALGIDPSRREAVTTAQEQIKAPWIEGAEDKTPRQIMQVLDSFIHELVVLKKHQTAGKPYAAEYARAYAECRAIRDRIAEWDTAFGLLVEAYQWLMIEQMTVEGVTSLTLANGQPIHTHEEPQAKVDDSEAFRRWCLAPPDRCMRCDGTADGVIHDELVGDPTYHIFEPGGGLSNKLALAWGTTNALTKEMLLNGEAEPPGISVWKKTVVRLGAGDK